MKERALREHATCSLCAKRIGDAGLPLFWAVTIERYGIDLRAAQRQDGLAALLGSPALAQAMGPDEDLAMPMMEPAKLTVCERCAVDQQLPIAVLAEARG